MSRRAPISRGALKSCMMQQGEEAAMVAAEEEAERLAAAKQEPTACVIVDSHGGSRLHAPAIDIPENVTVVFYSLAGCPVGIAPDVESAIKSRCGHHVRGGKGGFKAAHPVERYEYPGCIFDMAFTNVSTDYERLAAGFQNTVTFVPGGVKSIEKDGTTLGGILRDAEAAHRPGAEKIEVHIVSCRNFSDADASNEISLLTQSPHATYEAERAERAGLHEEECGWAKGVLNPEAAADSILKMSHVDQGRVLANLNEEQKETILSELKERGKEKEVNAAIEGWELGRMSYESGDSVGDLALESPVSPASIGVAGAARAMMKKASEAEEPGCPTSDDERRSELSSSDVDFAAELQDGLRDESGGELGDELERAMSLESYSGAQL